MAAIVNITCWNDADFMRSFIYQTTDSPPVAIDLTGSKLRMGIRHQAEDITEELLLTTENGGILLSNPVQGQFMVLITMAQLLGLPLGNYEHSLVRITAGGSHFRIWSGTLVNNAGASRGTNT